MSIVLLLVGLVMLVKGADFFVEGSSSIAKKFNIPSMVIGLTLVAFGTSAPELAVSVSGSLNQANGIVFGNVVGSNIINLLFILGLSCLIKPIQVHLKTIIKEMPFAILTTLALMLMAMDGLINGDSQSLVSKAEGWILILFFLIYLYSMLEIAVLEKEAYPEGQIHSIPLVKSIFLTIIGLLAIILGAKWVVDGAIDIARWLKISEITIGLTVVAIGTSLPELITSLVAAKKGENEIAVGNVIGSNIFNILFVLGLSSTIYPVSIGQENFVDLWILFAAMVVVVPLMYTGKKINRLEGALMVVAYLAYATFTVLRAVA